MPITFRHIQRGGSFISTSPQLPGWKCSGPTRELAKSQVAGSLQSYLRNERGIPPEIREDLKAMVASA